MAVVEGLDAQPITRREQLVLARVVDGEGKHSVQASKAVVSPLLVSLEHDFRVALRAKGMYEGLQLPTNLAVVVDLAIVSDPDGSVVVAHWLVPGRREIDYRETAVAEAAARLVEPRQPGTVGAAVTLHVGHTLKHLTAPTVQHAGDSAHCAHL